MQNQELITKFYTAFLNGDATKMLECYHNEVVFEDPAFGQLKGDRAKAMWKMLLSKREEINLSISFQVLNNHEALWTARYNYGPNKRSVTNNIRANFAFQDGKIIQHTDQFSLWKWSQQALGASGLVIGWSTFMRNKIQKTTNTLLDKYIAKANS